MEEDADDEGADDSANAESKLLQGDGLNEVALTDDVEHEGPSAGVVEGTAGSSNAGGDEEEVGFDSAKQEDNQHGSYNGQCDEVGGHDDVSSVLAVADGAGEEREGEHRDGAAESDEGHLPGGAGDLVDEPSHGEELGHISAGGDTAVGQQILEVPVSDDVEEGIFGTGLHGFSQCGRRPIRIERNYPLLYWRGRVIAIGLGVRGWVGLGVGLTMSEGCVGVDNIAISDISYADILEIFKDCPSGFYGRRGFGVEE